MYRRLHKGFIVLTLLTIALPAVAAEPLPANVAQAVVWIACSDRQGTGSVINGEQGYVLTNAHVAIDIATQTPAASCYVGFTESQGQPPTYIYQATVERFIFDQSRNKDFAILKIVSLVSRTGLNKPFPFLKTNEFPSVGQNLRILGFSNHDTDVVVDRSGKITGFNDGWIQIDAPIYPGDSGGAVIDDTYALIGLPTATLSVTSGTEVLTETSQVVDIRAIMNWLDIEGRDAHDIYITHLDYPRYHQAAVFIEQGSLGCDDLVRTPNNPAVYCVSLGNRYVFPNSAIYYSWIKDFSTVKIIDPTSLASLPITRNVTFKPGTLVKSATAPDVYVIVDSYGTMRGIPNEARAAALFGPNWSSLIHDIPDEFFSNYTIGQPLNS